MSPVFDEAKYRALLEKLEVSEVKISDIDESLRIDSSFYTGILCRYSKKISSITHTYFRNEIFKASKGIFDIKADQYCSVGIPFVRIGNLTNMQIDLSEIIYIPIEINAIHKTSALSFGDIIISKTAIPAASIVTLPQCNTSQDTIAIQLKKEATINSFYTVAYLNSCYGLALMENLFTGNIQKHFNLSDCKDKLPIPIFSTKLQNAIKVDMENGINRNERAKAVYIEAEQMLLQELGLTDWQPDDESVATKTFADFQNSGRLDAEYYQPKYEAIAEKLLQYSNGTVSCENILVNAMTKLTDGTQYCYLELADIGKSGEINSCSLDVAENLPSRARQKVKTNDVIVSSVEGSLTSCALITEEYNNAICSTGFHVLRSAEINPETLLLLMKSSPVQALLKQGCSGTILTAILPDALKAIKLPLIRKEVQTELAAKVQESFALRKESKRLLDLAKHAVEVAIEQGEDAAMKLLENVKNA